MKRRPYATPEEFVQNDLRRRRFSDTKEKQMLKRKFPDLTENEMNALLSIPPKTEEYEVLPNGLHRSTRVLKIVCAQDKTPESLMKAHGYDPLQWLMVSSSQKAWNTYSKLDKINDLFSSTITVKPIQNVFTYDEIKKQFELLKPPKLENYTYSPGEFLLEIPICDLHLSKYAWKRETGDDYDLKIAEQLYKDTIMSIIKDASLYKVDRIVFPLGQDFFNTDSSNPTTTKGTPQSMDTRWQKMYYKGCEIVIWAIEQLRSIAPVDIQYVPGNHDFALSYFLTLHVNAWYRNCKNVNVDLSPKIRKYYQYGKCMIGYSHGEEKPSNLDKLMQSEAPEIWGNTKFRELHLGHKHCETVKEYPGFIQRRISSITATDDWHNEMGYVQTVRKAQAFLWDKTDGLKHILNISVNSLTKVA